jgi:hypothetical protein
MLKFTNLPLLASVILAAAVVHAQTSTALFTHRLDRTAIWVQTNQRSATSLGFDGSFGLIPLFNTPGIVGFKCLQPAGTKCIYHISVESVITLTSPDPNGCSSAIRFLVDNRAPTPGPPGGRGPGANSGGLEGEFAGIVNPPADSRPHTVSVVAIVTNAVANQLHTIKLDLYVTSGIEECTATASYAIATLQLYH